MFHTNKSFSVLFCSNFELGFRGVKQSYIPETCKILHNEQRIECF